MPNDTSLTTIAGVVAQEEVVRLRRLIFRATKGKSFIHVEQFEYEEEFEGDNPEVRSVYIIMFLDGPTVRDRIKKICDSFQGERFDIPTAQDEFAVTISKVEKSIEDT